HRRVAAMIQTAPAADKQIAPGFAGPLPPELLMGEYLLYRHGSTLDDYYRFANEDTRLDFIDGVLILHSPANIGHEDRFAFLLIILRGFAAATGAGRAFGSRTPIALAGKRAEPDLLFVTREHLSWIGETEIAGPPDLVIEILSPSTRDYDLGLKRRLYADGK